jgi:hypothetical protein
MKHGFYCCRSTVALLRICCVTTGIVLLLVPWECVYRVVARKRAWYIHPFSGRCIATALRATIHCQHRGAVNGLRLPREVHSSLEAVRQSVVTQRTGALRLRNA